MNASNVRNSSTPATSSVLRPRTRRLISGLDEADEPTLDPSTAASSRIASPLLSPYESRAASPIPASHLPRPSSRDDTRGGRGTGSVGRVSGPRPRKGGTESPKLADLWGSSWTTLQSIASDLLSGDGAAETQVKDGRVRRPPGKTNTQRSASRAPPGQWGPASQSATTAIGTGTREEQLAALRAQKRKNMLMRQETSYADTLGKFKRRLSDDHPSASAPPGENEDRDALVYVHHVQKSDTLAGITIKYNCSANVVRKTNRMWPNDVVQVRSTIILPVDACGVKGKPVPGPEAVDLLTTESNALSAGQAEEVPATDSKLAENEDAYNRNRTNSSSTHTSHRASSSVGAASIESEQPWQHDSWVLLPGSTKPTEIARLSRRALGYFPPTRRKSNCYSDLDTPSASFDLARTGTNDASSMSPGREDKFQRPSRTRRPSNANNGYFPAYLAGPGGVGTMDRRVHCPGPAQDGLNKMFARHLPDVAPPRHQQSLLTPEMPLYNADDSTPITSGATTPNFGKNLNLENVGGAIESWMRRMATQTKAAVTPAERQQAARASLGAPGRGGNGIGDLIEMTDEFEIGGDEDEDDSNRGRQGSAVYVGQRSAAHSQVGRERGGVKSGKKD